MDKIKIKLINNPVEIKLESVEIFELKKNEASNIKRRMNKLHISTVVSKYVDTNTYAISIYERFPIITINEKGIILQLQYNRWR